MKTPLRKDFSNAGQPLDASDSPQLQNYYAGVANMGGISLDSSTAQADLRCETADADGNLYDINTDLATRGACHAQYVLNHEFVFKYGDLPHFKPGYIGCDICESVIAVKAFHEDCDGTITEISGEHAISCLCKGLAHLAKYDNVKGGQPKGETRSIHVWTKFFLQDGQYV